MVSDGPREPDESPGDANKPDATKPDANEPDATQPDGDLGNTVERPPADPWAEETEIRPLSDRPLSDLPPTQIPPTQVPPTQVPPTQVPPPGGPNVGPSGTGVLPTVPDQPPQPRWSARAQVRTPDIEEQHDEEWVDPGRNPLTPVLIAVGVLVLISLIVLGAVLLLNNGDSPNPAPTATNTVQLTTPAPTTAATRSTAPTSTAPVPIEIPDVKGLDYDAAAAKISAAGFVPARRDEVSTQQLPGRVVGCDPSIGTKQPPGSTVTIIVAKIVPTTPALTTTRPPTANPTTPGPVTSS